MLIAVHPYAQDACVPGKPTTHFTGGWAEVIRRVKRNWKKRRRGDNAGSFVVSISPKGFFAPTVVPTNHEISSRFEERWRKEAKVLHTSGKGKKAPAKYVDVVLYTEAQLKRDGDQDRLPGADYEIITLLGRTQKAPEPMDPVTMARNCLGKAGGTPPRKMPTAKQVLEAVWFWNTHVKVSE